MKVETECVTGCHTTQGRTKGDTISLLSVIAVPQIEDDCGNNTRVSYNIL
jgi:hypothetical protein